ncbi:MAG: SgcJ/EcaC family oxidoreductase [Xenococcaceae cyanobacterium MO_188.B19]|nr:SgcJ/EcaC family oxidoreductase [Xenococcaceae cyanobacterium MO_188.B19]MDJ0682935.1 SgcJ/EcaC family oxidoreductase [Xenococcaceae cyanobacterium MO_167.B52]
MKPPTTRSTVNKKLIFHRSKPLKNIFLLSLLNVLFIPSVIAQEVGESNNQKQEIYLLIEQYNQARENKDTDLLENILTTDVDQLVSSGEWRRGIETAVQGMLRSSNRNPGKRTITVEQIRLLNSEVAIVDTRYEIQLEDGAVRNLWSTFLVVRQEGEWKITGIRNMSPANRIRRN